MQQIIIGNAAIKNQEWSNKYLGKQQIIFGNAAINIGNAALKYR